MPAASLKSIDISRIGSATFVSVDFVINYNSNVGCIIDDTWLTDEDIVPRAINAPHVGGDATGVVVVGTPALWCDDSTAGLILVAISKAIQAAVPGHFAFVFDARM